MQTSIPSITLPTTASNGAGTALTTVYTGSVDEHTAVVLIKTVVTSSYISGSGIVNTLQYNTSYSKTGAEPTGTTYWNNDEKSIDSVLVDGTILQNGQEVLYRVKNQTGTTLTDGTAVRFDGAIGNSGIFKVAPMLGNNQYPSDYFMGLVTHDILDGADGYVTHFGKVRGLDLRPSGIANGETWVDGDILYLSSTSVGKLTKIEPVAPNNKIMVAGVITSGNNGTLFVRPHSHGRMLDLEDVDGSNYKTGDILIYDSASGYFTNTQTASYSNVSKELRNGENYIYWDSNIRFESNQGTSLIGYNAETQITQNAGVYSITISGNDSGFYVSNAGDRNFIALETIEGVSGSIHIDDSTSGGSGVIISSINGVKISNTKATGSLFGTASYANLSKELLDGTNRIYKNGDAFNVVGDFNVDPADTFTVNLNNANSSAGINSLGTGNTIGLYNLGQNGLILIQNDSGADNSSINIENTATNGLLNIENQGAGGVINIANASGKIDILASTVNINAAKVTGSLLGKVIPPIVEKTTNYTVTNNDYTVIASGSGAITFTLPSIATSYSQLFVFKNVSNYPMYINGNGALIDDNTTLTASYKNTSIQLQAGTTKWYIL